MLRRNFALSTFAVSSPSTRMRPPVGSIIRLIIRKDVVLPQPDGPTNTVVWPVGASKLNPPTATVPSGYFLVTDSNVIIGVASLPIARMSVVSSAERDNEPCTRAGQHAAQGAPQFDL